MSDESTPGFSQFRARLQVWSSDSPAALVTERLGVRPGNIGVKGDVWNARSGALYERHLWESHVVAGTDGDIGAHLTQLVAEFSACQDELAGLAAEPGTEVTILLAIEVDSDRVLDVPHLDLEPDLVAAIAALGAQLDVDIQLQ